MIMTNFELEHKLYPIDSRIHAISPKVYSGELTEMRLIQAITISGKDYIYTIDIPVCCMI